MMAWALFCHDFDLSKGINILSEKCPVVLDHYSFEKLNRDYTGMLRFNTFVKQGMISMPIIAKSDIEITNTGTRLTMDETLLRLTVLSRFNSQMDSWNAWVKPAAQVQKMDHIKTVLTDEARKNAQKN